MPRHNNAIQRPHLRKHPRPLIRTFFNQPAKKLQRLQKRQQRAAEIYPRPLNKLKPIVHKPTQRYSSQVRLGRGFTLEEIKAVGLSKLFARSVGINVDTRRTNKSNESLQKNIQRLKEYLDKLVLLPRKTGNPKKGGYLKLNEELNSVTVVQNTDRVILPLKKKRFSEKSKKITKDMTHFNPKEKLGLEKMLKKKHNKKGAKKEEEN